MAASKRPYQDQMKPKAIETLLLKQRVGRLATVDTSGRPVVIPFCFVYDGKVFYSALDEKPKSVAPAKLRRSRNIQRNPEVAFVLDHYEEDWNCLWFVLVRGRARILRSGREHVRALQLLRRKYPQYRRMHLENRPVIKIVPWKIRYWDARNKYHEGTKTQRNTKSLRAKTP
jgi:PPOX class probable F420-dependent enzyme